MTIEELFGTLQQSITKQWRDHLKTNKYSKHMALDEFYKEMPEKVDALIEAWQADNDPVEDYKNILDEGMDALDYLKELKKLCKDGRKELLGGESELESLMDDILSLIDSTIYKVEKLHENAIPLKMYLEQLLDQSNKTKSIKWYESVDLNDKDAVWSVLEPLIEAKKARLVTETRPKYDPEESYIEKDSYLPGISIKIPIHKYSWKSQYGSRDSIAYVNVMFDDYGNRANIGSMENFWGDGRGNVIGIPTIEALVLMNYAFKKHILKSWNPEYKSKTASDRDKKIVEQWIKKNIRK